MSRLNDALCMPRATSFHLLYRTALLASLWVGFVACEPEPEEGPPAVRVEGLQYTLEPNGVRLIRGKLHNESDQLLRTVRVQIALFDGQNRRISELTIDVKNVQPGSPKTFREAVRTDIDVRGAKLDRIFVL